jgi:SSS family solute:Na+ symporter
MTFTPLLGLLVAYSAGLILLGAWIGRRVRRPGDFFVSGRTLGTGLVFATFLAPNVGAGSTVGATSLGYNTGLSAWWWNGSAGLGSLVLAFWVGPRLWREASRFGFLTVGDFLEHHYGRSVRGLAAVIIWCGTLWVLCGQLDGVAAVLKEAGGLPHALGCFVAMLVIAAYFIGGGLESAARVNGVQLAVKLAGFALALPLALAAAGGFAAVTAANADRFDFWQRTVRNEGWPLIATIAPAFFLSPGLLQKAYAAKNETALTRGVALNAVILLIFAFVPVMLGLSAHTLFPGLANPDDALPRVLSVLPLAVGGLALAAVFSAELSAGDAVLFMLSTSGARDLYKAFIRPDATDRQVLRAARLSAAIGAAIAFALTFIYPTVVSALKIFYAVLVVSLFAPLLGALYWPRGRRGAMVSIAAGVIVLVCVQVLTGGRGFGVASPTVAGLAASMLVYWLTPQDPTAR